MEVRRQDRWQPVSALKQRTLLAILLIGAGGPVSMDRLIDGLWSKEPADPANQVHLLVSRLRRLLGDDDANVIETVSPGYRLTLAPEDCDAGRFVKLAEQGAAAFHNGELEKAATLLSEALTLWRGPAFADTRLAPTVATESAKLEERRLAVLESHLDIELRLGRHASHIAELQRLVDDHPFREQLCAHLMLALYRSGRQAEALQTYQATYRRLDDELGIQPGRDLQQLHQRILRRDPDLDRGVLPSGTATVAGTGDAEPAPTHPPAPLPADVTGFSGRALDLVRLDPEVPAQLPLDVAAFAGRDGELARLDAALAGTGQRPGAVVISALLGTAGVGKTALAIHWAHRVADRFPDGQLYVNLRGFAPSGSATEPAAAVRRFLDAFGVPAHRIPTDLDAQAGLYRSLVAGRRVLVVLDNARDAEQVRPLLPGAPGCLVVVTSRDQLTGLVTAEAAHPITLDLLSQDEARQLLARRLGAERVAAEPRAAEEIIARCARLPLALAIVAARAAAHPGFPLDALAAELRETPAGLGAFASGDTASDVRAVFSWSYRTLSDGAARLFRLLGVHHGPEVAGLAAASLASLPAAQTRPLLAELAHTHLISEHTPGRYTFHDLLRAYAAELAHTCETEDERHAALHRTLDHYLHTAHGADRLLHPLWDPISPPPPQPGVAHEVLTDYAEAMTWFTTEHPVLLAAVGRAAQAGFATHAWQLARTLTTYFDRRGQWHDWAATQRTALEATRRLDDRTGQAHAHRDLGRAYALLGRFADAHPHLRQALDLFGEFGDRTGQARTHQFLNWVFDQQGDQKEALRHAEQALDLYRADDNRAGQARALNSIGWLRSQLGDNRQALIDCRRALTLHQEVGNTAGQAATWDSLGYTHHNLSDHQQAITCYRHARDLYRDLHDRYEEAKTLVHLGDTHHAAADTNAANDAWRHALMILTDLHHPDAEQVRTKLHNLAPCASPRPARRTPMN